MTRKIFQVWRFFEIQESINLPIYFPGTILDTSIIKPSKCPNVLVKYFQNYPQIILTHRQDGSKR